MAPLGSYDTRFDDFTSNRNESGTNLTTFAHDSIRDTENFTLLFEEAVENDYTSRMWDRDVTLVLRVSGLNSPSQFRITVDQEDYFYLIYFFATFITYVGYVSRLSWVVCLPYNFSRCFSVLLTALLVGWFIKKKLAMRAYMRVSFIAIPFSSSLYT